MATTDKTARFLSNKTPLPNIVRIEELTLNARKRYLQGPQGLNAALVNSRPYEKGQGVIFYGFKTNSSEKLNYTIDSRWYKNQTTEGLLGLVTGIASSTATSLSSIGGKVGASAQTLTGAAGLAKGAIEAVSGLAGIDYKNTGSNTMREFKSLNLQDLNVKCGWYMPEQYDIAMKSIRTLHRMIYPRAADNVVSDLFKSLATSISSIGIVNTVLGDTTNAVNNIANSISKADQLTVDVVNATGYNLTYDPLPVRLSVGQYMDIEPLILKNMKLSFSSEMFIKDGKTYPMFCEVDLTFEFWVTPDPSMEFMKILDTEMFGRENLMDHKTDGRFNTGGK